MKSSFLFIGFFLIFLGCGKENKKNDPLLENSLYRYSFCINFSNELKNKHNLKIIGWGGSFYVLSLTFEAPGYCDQDQARKLIIECADECLKRLNADSRMRTIMKKKPWDLSKKPEWASVTDFDYSNVDFHISFQKDRTVREKPNISFVTFSDGCIDYFVVMQGTDRNTHMAEEKIEVALKKLQQRTEPD